MSAHKSTEALVDIMIFIVRKLLSEEKMFQENQFFFIFNEETFNFPFSFSPVENK